MVLVTNQMKIGAMTKMQHSHRIGEFAKPHAFARRLISNFNCSYFLYFIVVFNAINNGVYSVAMCCW